MTSPSQPSRPSPPYPLFIIAIFLCLLGALSVASNALAQDSDSASVEAFRTPVIAIIEYEKIERNSTAWKSFSEQFEAQRNRYQATIKTQQDELKQRQEELQSQTNILSPETLAEEDRKFREDVAALQKQAGEGKRNLDDVFYKARSQFRLNIASIAAEVARERKVDIVINKSPNDNVLFFWSQDLSITDEVLKRFNEKFPESSISIE